MHFDYTYVYRKMPVRLAMEPHNGDRPYNVEIPRRTLTANVVSVVYAYRMHRIVECGWRFSVGHVNVKGKFSIQHYTDYVCICYACG